MISIKGGTKTWSESPQESSLKGAEKEKISKEDLMKHYGTDNIGEALNKISDPNWVDPKKMRRVGNSSLDKDAFLKLFLAQLKHQDPTNPLKSHEMAAQLAQFTSLEKLDGIDSGIKTMNKQNDPAQSFDTLKLIGKAISGDSSKIIRTDSTEKHDITFNLPGEARKAEITVLNRVGQVVKEFEVKDLKSGKNKIVWNGTDKNDRQAREGEYQVMIKAEASNGKKLNADTKFSGVVSGVNFTAEGPVLMIGKKSVRMSEVRKIFQPDAKSLTAIHEAKATEINKDDKSMDTGNLDQVGMSRGLINKLSQQTGGIKGVN